MNFPMRFAVSKFGPQAFMWVPESLKTERRMNVVGCECLGTGTRGKIVDDRFPGRLEGQIEEVSHRVPCVCLYAVIHDEVQYYLVESEVNGHYMDVANSG